MSLSVGLSKCVDVFDEIWQDDNTLIEEQLISCDNSFDFIEIICVHTKVNTRGGRKLACIKGTPIGKFWSFLDFLGFFRWCYMSGYSLNDQ